MPSTVLADRTAGVGTSSPNLFEIAIALLEPLCPTRACTRPSKTRMPRACGGPLLILPQVGELTVLLDQELVTGNRAGQRRALGARVYRRGILRVHGVHVERVKAGVQSWRRRRE